MFLSSLSTWKKIREDRLAEIRGYDTDIDRLYEEIIQYNGRLNEVRGDPSMTRTLNHLKSKEEKKLAAKQVLKKRAETELKKAEKAIKSLEG